MKYIKICFLVIVLFTISGCKKWLEINTDPATPQVTKAEYLLPPIIYQMANNTATDYRVIFKYTQDMFSQDVIAASINWDKHGYAVANDLGGSLWRMVYINFGLNLEEMIKDAEANQKWTYAGIGYAVKAWGYQMLTDSHGPVILDDVFAKDKLSFTYTEQDKVYLYVRELCYKALATLEKPDGADYSAVLSSISGDNMYKGDRAKWRKFIYGILALQYSHLVNKPQFKTSYADSVIKYTDAAISFSSAQDDATILFNGSNANDSNPFGQNSALITPVAYGRIGQPIVDLLTGGVRGNPTLNPKTSVDPRLTRMINPIAAGTSAGVYRGVMPTLGDDATTKTIPHVLGSLSGTSTAPFPGKYIFANAARYPIMTYAQLQFARAEAYFHKGSNMQLAHAAYLNGIRGHMDFINLYGRNGSPAASAITSTEIDTYLNSSEVATPLNLTLADIMGQKYIAQWGWAGMEQWTDLRKYHYDPLIFKQYKQLEVSQFFASNNGKYAYRLRPRYNSEYMWNKKELERFGGLNLDYHTYEPWFNLVN